MALAAFLLPSVAHAQAAAESADEAPAQPPLGDALEEFSRRFSFDIVYPESLVHGLRAGPVTSAASPHRALDQLLRGTGLVARFTRPDAIILEPAGATSAPDMTLDALEVRPPTSAADASAYEWYGQRLLEASLDILRKSTGLAAKPYDLFVYVWVDGAGKVTDLRVYAGTGEEREAGVASDVLRALALPTPPPRDMPQPVGLRIASH
ncbi:MAG: hypothetical protein B7Z08_08370 [Sphingomonadales bacterium 32-68-7]|nr:MAG: hypothetical protein B7Z33_10160 [Sphingomonadales bacterium 12-68-11]OYX08720.1 MAG: hypothetical protein B7Z08_08370 [Sphingomonadales bacterium 32-68-7]